ncbi:MAG: IS1380 family transposase, partial [Armatimonadetes bacterium]|nr:IS1380 family transposase [Armatimonadota bacterium]NIM24605.1 IS1380 family transposase [Armatimonadota bacterium]NIM68481.1 IS1380 family transposase [Armatimonadota bacterium]NIN06678.1 IS1380 family transposase [Armatimonadota bacterium]NIO98389.1 IS1380 family transposase [Armatimonadota bacterium]
KVACWKRPSLSEALASQPTISRFENGIGRKELLRMAKGMARLVVRQLPAETKEVILDLDATDDPCHGQQELRLFDGHLGAYCYVPLYLHITDETGRQRLMGTLLRSACGRSTKGVMSLVRLAVRLVRERFPDVRIVLRGDCGFGYGKLMNWCDAHGVDYVFALQVTKPVQEMALPVQMDVAIKHSRAGEGCREYGDVPYRGKTWDTERRIVIKAEAKGGVIDTRYVVTSDTELSAEEVYIWYTQRGDLENRIKEMKLDLSSGRTSCHRFLANQFRLML